jgi:hypothetical protein
MKLQYRPREDRIETAIRLPPSKHAIDPGIVNLRVSVLILFNRQFLPLTPRVQQLQNVTKEGMQGKFRRWAPASNAQVRQDKLPELLEVQFRRNALPLLTFRHFGPPRKRDHRSAQATAPKISNPRTLQANPISLKTRNQ